MSYVKSGGQVIEFNGRRKASYANPIKKPERLEEVEEKPASIGVRAAGIVLRRISKWVSGRLGVEIITAQASFREDGYALWISATKDNVQHVAMFCEDPGCKFKVWPK